MYPWNQKAEARKSARAEALSKIAELPQDIREAIAMFVENADTQGFTSDGWVWEDDVQETLKAIAKDIRCDAEAV